MQKTILLAAVFAVAAGTSSAQTAPPEPCPDGQKGFFSRSEAREIVYECRQVPTCSGTTKPLMIAGDAEKPIRCATVPERIEGEAPGYPREAWAAKAEGRVILLVVIDTSGAVKDAGVLHSQRPGVGFEEAALEGVKQWTYRPASVKSKPAPVYFTVVVNFERKKDVS